MTELDDYVWNDAAIAKLEKLWLQGLSTARIGERFGVSKNSIIGKARRLGLPARTNPIAGMPPAKEKTPRRAGRTARTLPSLAKPVILQETQAKTSKNFGPEPDASETHIPPPDRFGAASVEVVAPAPHTSRGRGCMFPLGERLPRGGYRECGDAPMLKPGTDTPLSYCAHHIAVAYIRVGTRRDNAA
jgi:GcrA cell cycle regulator